MCFSLLSKCFCSHSPHDTSSFWFSITWRADPLHYITWCGQNINNNAVYIDNNDINKELVSGEKQQEQAKALPNSVTLLIQQILNYFKILLKILSTAMPKRTNDWHKRYFMDQIIIVNISRFTSERAHAHPLSSQTSELKINQDTATISQGLFLRRWSQIEMKKNEYMSSSCWIEKCKQNARMLRRAALLVKGNKKYYIFNIFQF